MNGVTVKVERLANHLRGFYDRATRTIFIDDRLTPSGQRCTLVHEYIHHERGDVDPGDPWWRSKQERLVHQEAARRLIPFDQLLDAVRFCDDPHHICEALFVDRVTLDARIVALTDTERDELEAAARSRDSC